jgi:hypothetical protein
LDPPWLVGHVMTHSTTTVEWQLEQLPVGADVMIKDEHGHLVARGTVNVDRVSLRGPGGEQIPLLTGRGWSVVVLSQRGVAPRNSRAQ